MTNKTAKLFVNGGSQAVRLPAEFRFDGLDEVYIRRDTVTGDVILSAHRISTAWSDFFSLRDETEVEPRMRKFWSVSGQLIEVQRYINVPMRWCEQYPARERRELWVSTTGGNDIKLIVHSREMPARRGHQMTALLLGERLVALYNVTTGKQVHYVRTDPPLL